MAHQLITSHGGHIDITSQVNQGTTVTVTLPCQPWQGEYTMRKASQVLVIDDNPRMVDLLQRWLVRASYQTIGVTTVQAVLEALTASANAPLPKALMLS